MQMQEQQDKRCFCKLCTPFLYLSSFGSLFILHDQQGCASYLHPYFKPHRSNWQCEIAETLHFLRLLRQN